MFGRDLRDRDRLERAAAELGMTVRLYSPGAWDDIDPPDLVVIDLDRVPIPENLPEAVPVLGYFSHVNEHAERDATAAGIEAIPRGRFWSELGRLLER